MKCDFCNCDLLIKVYDVPTSLMGAQIFSCSSCGLLHSNYLDKRITNKKPKLSCDADWGNIRHGKGIRLNHSLNLLAPHFKKDKIERILDIGSNRGHFCNWAATNSEAKVIDAVECDGTIVNDYHDKINLIISRFEKLNFKKNYYDLIYCCHTLEHILKPSHLFKTANFSLRNNGYLYIEVPNAEVIESSNNLEEFFIDKHTFHFFPHTLLQYFFKSNFLKVVRINIDKFNITVLAQKQSQPGSFWSDNYTRTLDLNRNKLPELVRRINEIAVGKKLAFYGAGKVIDAIVKYGGFDMRKVNLIVDDYMADYMPEVYGIPVVKSYDSKISHAIDIVFLSGRSSNKILKDNIKTLNFRDDIQVVNLIDLLNSL